MFTSPVICMKSLRFYLQAVHFQSSLFVKHRQLHAREHGGEEVENLFFASFFWGCNLAGACTRLCGCATPSSPSVRGVPASARRHAVFARSAAIRTLRPELIIFGRAKPATHCFNSGCSQDMQDVMLSHISIPYRKNSHKYLYWYGICTSILLIFISAWFS
jgi:hypothetical protein